MTDALLRSLIGGTVLGTVGVEEELLLVDRASGAPVDVAAEVVAAVGDRRVKPELMACQVEIATSVHHDVSGAIEELRLCRKLLAAACPPGVAVIAAPAHPQTDVISSLTTTPRADGMRNRYREIIGRQLVSSLQVHLAFGDADCTLAVYHGLRNLLPELAALAGAAPFAGGRDTGLCSVRPIIAAGLPRQGVPPIIDSWQQYVEDLAWAVRGQAVADSSEWWWELRPHPRYGTLELRVLDVQSTTARTAAVVRFVHALGLWLADRYRCGDSWPAAPSWRIAENRWIALRDGVRGTLLDLQSGDPRPAHRALHGLIDTVEPFAGSSLDEVRAMVDDPPVDHLRALGPAGVIPWLTEVVTA